MNYHKLFYPGSEEYRIILVNNESTDLKSDTSLILISKYFNYSQAPCPKSSDVKTIQKERILGNVKLRNYVHMHTYINVVKFCSSE